MRYMFALVAASLAVSQDGNQEWAGRWDRLVKKAAEEHYKLGDYLEISKMFKWARMEYEKALALNPEHERARKKLEKIENNNRKTGDEALRVEEEYLKRQEKMGKPLAKDFAELGDWAKKQGLTAEADRAYKKALEYDPDNAKARQALGHTKDKDRWISPWEKQMQADFKDGIAKAPQGEEVKESTAIEQGLNQKHNKRKSSRFLAESPHLTSAQLARCVQMAEHAVAMYKKLFTMSEDPIPQEKYPMNHILLKTKEQHAAYIDKFDNRPATEKKQVKEMVGTSDADPPMGECWQGEHPESFVHDFVVHTTVHALSMWHHRGDRPWLTEGMAYYFTRLMNNTAQVHCVRFEGTKTEGGKNFNDPGNWPLIIREWMKTGKDPDMNAVIKSALNDLTAERTVKAWSVIDFLFAEHREKFLELHKALASDPKDKGEKAFQQVFNWSLEELNARWKEFARRSY